MDAYRFGVPLNLGCLTKIYWSGNDAIWSFPFGKLFLCGQVFAYKGTLVDKICVGVCSGNVLECPRRQFTFLRPYDVKILLDISLNVALFKKLHVRNAEETFYRITDEFPNRPINL